MPALRKTRNRLGLNSRAALSLYVVEYNGFIRDCLKVCTGGTSGLLAAQAGVGRMWVEALRECSPLCYLRSPLLRSRSSPCITGGRAWRGGLDHPLLTRLLAAANLDAGHMKGEDFATFAGLHELTPDLRTNGGGLTLVRAYYRVIEGLAVLSEGRMPGVAAWCERERVICARFAAVQIDRRLQGNLALAAALRSC